MSGGFDPESARRIAEAVRRVEQFARNQPSRPRGANHQRDGVLCVTSSVITARSGTSPNFTAGTGTANILAIAANSSLVATTSSAGHTINIYHLGPASVPSGTLVQCKWLGPVLLVDVEYC